LRNSYQTLGVVVVGWSDVKATPAPQREGHLDGVDLMRVITIAGVIAVHVVTGTNRPTSVPAGAATILLHVNREVFVLLTALVLTYSYGGRAAWSLREFWARRYWLVATPYVAWTAIYFLADGPPGSVADALRQLAADLASGMARYHLYFLLVTMQLYLVFPALLVLVRATRGSHRLLLAAGAAVQLAFTAAIHYRLAAGGPLGWWLAHPDALLPSYVLYVLAGAVIADHMRELAAWVRGHRAMVAAAVLGGTGAALGSYVYDVSFRVQGPLVASEVFQPAVTVESLAIVLGMYALGVWWADRLRPARLVRLVRQASDASFGIYLAHPLVLQGVLALGGLTGLAAWLLGLPGRYTLVIGLAGVLPVVLALTWAGVWLARRSPLSLPLAGRNPVRAPVRRRPAWAADGLRVIALAAALAGAVSWLDLSSVRLAAPGAALAGPYVGPPGQLSATLAAADAPVPPAGAQATVENLVAGGLRRSYQVVRPVVPVAARLPAVIFLHGVNIDLGGEEVRDGLLPLVTSGQLLLVYPAGYQESWNAGSCCGGAQLRDVDDGAFLTALARRVAADPGVDAARVSLVGYSNGGKMAYRLACDHPRLFPTVAVVLALPMTGCQSGAPVSLLQVAVLDDAEIPYAPGEGPFTANGVVLTPVTSEVAAWRTRDGCTGDDAARTTGQLRTELWSRCQGGSRVELATYAGGGHYWPAGDAATPPAGQVVWDFVSS
jgi:poly(3-hydroxybutyrate) depolymerase/peptidoglycan/LPS O-acetylase OafA/YrhL